jgi:hypothetical protein
MTGITYVTDDTGRHVGLPQQSPSIRENKIGSGLLVYRTDESGRRTEIDMRNLSVGGRPCRDLTQAELFRALKHIVPDVRVDDGHQMLTEKLAACLAAEGNR